jgi:hypothetical protein
MRTLGRTMPFKTLATLTLVTLVVAGCDGGSDGLPREAVSGAITLDGQPLAEGSIQMIPIDPKEGRPGGAIIKDGKYSIDRGQGLVPGQYNVVISSIDATSVSAPAGGPPGPVAASDKPKNLIPPEYNTRSALTIEVKSGSPNTFPFELKSK